MPASHKLIWGALGLVLFGTIFWAGYHRLRAGGTWGPVADPPPNEPPPLPVLWDAPDFTLTERDGRTVTRADLLGRVWVADFIFTSCGGQCPAMSAKLAELQDGYAGASFISFCVDPERDTPERMKEHAERYGADPKRWWFVTGERTVLWKVAGEGFRLSVVDNPGDTREPISHSPRFVLIDREGRVRGTYQSTEDESMRQLREDLLRLLR